MRHFTTYQFYHSPASVCQNLALKQSTNTNPVHTFPLHSWVYRIPCHPSVFSCPGLLFLAYSVVIVQKQFSKFDHFTAPHKLFWFSYTL